MFSRVSVDRSPQQDFDVNLRESEPLIPVATSSSSDPNPAAITHPPRLNTATTSITHQDSPSTFQYASIYPPNDSRLPLGTAALNVLSQNRGDLAVDDLPYARLSVVHPVESAEEILQSVEAEVERSPLLSRRSSMSLSIWPARRMPGASSGGSSHTSHPSPQLASSPPSHTHPAHWRTDNVPNPTAASTAPLHAAATTAATWKSIAGSSPADPSLDLLSGGVNVYNTRGSLLASVVVGGGEIAAAGGTGTMGALAPSSQHLGPTTSAGVLRAIETIAAEVSLRQLPDARIPEGVATPSGGGSDGGSGAVLPIMTATRAASLPQISMDATGIVSAGTTGGGGGDGGGGRVAGRGGGGGPPVHSSASALVPPQRPSSTLGMGGGGHGGGGAGGEKKFGIAGVRTWLKVLPDGSASIVQLDRQQLGVQYGVQLRDFRVLDPVLGVTYPSCLLCREGALIVNLEHIKVIITAQFVLVNHADSDKARPFTEELKRRLQCTSGTPTGPASATTTTTRSPLQHPLGPHARVASSPSLLTGGGGGSGHGGSGSGGAGAVSGLGVSRLAATSTQATEAAAGPAGALVQSPIAQVASAIMSLLPTALLPTSSPPAWGLHPPTWPPAPSGGAAGGTGGSLSGGIHESGVGGGHVSELFCSMPFELRVLEVVLEQTASLLDAQTTELERATRLALDELTARVTPRNLECMRNLKGRKAGLTVKVDTVRGVLEKLLDDDRAMTSLNLTARLHEDTSSIGVETKATIGISSLKPVEAVIAPPLRAYVGATDDQQVPLSLPVKQQPLLLQRSSYGGHDGEPGLEEVAMVEMLLEAYFMQLGHSWQRLQSLKSYIDSTEDLINLELDQQRNNLISVDLMVTFASFLLTAMSVIAGLFGMNVTNGMETDYSAFLGICIGSAMAAATLWLCFVYCAIRCGLMNGLSMTWR